MNRLQSLRAEREFCVTLNRTECDRPGEGDPDDRVRPSGLHGRRRRGAAALRRDQRPAGARISAAPTGAGGSTRTAFAARCGWPSGSADGCDAAVAVSRDSDGSDAGAAASTRARSATGGPSRGASSAIALALFYLDLDELPALLGGRLTAPSPGLLRFRRRDYLRPRVASARHRGPRRGRKRRTGVRPEGPIRLLTQLRSFGHCFNPVSFYYCLDAGRASWSRRSSPRSRTRRGASGTRTSCRGGSSRQRSTSSCTCRRSWGWIIATRRAPARPANAWRSTSRAAAPASSPFDATLALAPPRADPRSAARAHRALPARERPRAGADLRPRGRPEARGRPRVPASGSGRSVIDADREMAAVAVPETDQDRHAHRDRSRRAAHVRLGAAGGDDPGPLAPDVADGADGQPWSGRGLRAGPVGFTRSRRARPAGGAQRGRARPPARV